MKGLGFFARLIAIFWLFGLVIANFGESWLSHDGPLTRREKPAPDPMAVKPLAQIAEEARPRGPLPSGGRRDSARRKDAGWGAGSWEDHLPAGASDSASGWGDQ